MPEIRLILESVFSYLPEVVGMILRFLPARELRTTARVNRTWRDVSVRLLLSRMEWKAHYLEDKLITGNEIDDVIENIYSEPRMVIHLSHREIWFTRRDPRRRRNEERQLVRSVYNLFSKLPPGCVTLGCTTERILFQKPMDDLGPNHIHHLKAGHAFLCAPSMPGVKYHHVYLRTPRPPPGGDWPDMFELAADSPVKLVIMIALSASRDFIPFLAAGTANKNKFCLLFWRLRSLIVKSFYTSKCEGNGEIDSNTRKPKHRNIRLYLILGLKGLNETFNPFTKPQNSIPNDVRILLAISRLKLK